MFRRELTLSVSDNESRGTVGNDRNTFLADSTNPFLKLRLVQKLDRSSEAGPRAKFRARSG